jgi:hypothetical protein
MAQIMWLLPLPLFFCLHGWLCRVHFDLLVDHRHHLMLLKKKDGKKMQDSVTDIRVAALLLSLCSARSVKRSASMSDKHRIFRILIMFDKKRFPLLQRASFKTDTKSTRIENGH